MRLIWGNVAEVVHQRDGVSELQVTVDGRTGQARAICYPNLTGSVAVGERVLLNTTAVDWQLGTGGSHFVVARAQGADLRDDNTAVQFEADMPDAGSEETDDVRAGHLMKLRYTPHQLNVLSVEAQESPHHKVMENRDSLEGVPVVCCGLHSQVPIVAAAIKKAMPDLTVGYVMDDAAALVLPLSKVLADATQAGLIDCTVSTGQAFGGDIEAINLYSGLIAAVHIGACDVVITGIGPGLAGTGTPFGHGGVAQGEAINAVASLGGNPVMCLRMSQADSRSRHLGISHHSQTALARVALAPATVALPHMADNCSVRELVDEQLDALPNTVGHQAFQFDATLFDVADLRDVVVNTMGRDFAQDPIFYEAAAAAGTAAAMMAMMEPVPENEAETEEQTAIAGAGTAATAARNDATAGHTCAGSSCASPCASRQKD
ncbi:MAG: DUF3866 family protein [Coriobacteriia bacterium]|nr:DUF3866 family protein [Coriobacteriia bacterium]MCL2606881.1 DUF3866 family protein [Coriobacteriia bacterium]